ncbi:M16 family metallopeptidase [Phaeodactylibacter luteus]|uniref:Insulinase family protein n=1 Tax=Phaeodactylibacter luteus TaxID=1564516 RepID=A0A5C6RJ27_9BACT|nr:pitrilysin family protein [Phaeodactylibacter luteus]TXB61979.1 insulinase family protein [Phaeodactylibacter luteus]
MTLARKIALLLAFAVGVPSLFAQERGIEFETMKLDNGLEVILHQDKSTPIVALAVMYHVGSKNENPDRTGFAHFFEHLLFEGSENIERGQFDKYIQNAGGTLNAYTSSDVTCYFEILPSNQLELGLWLESERMLHAKVDQKGVETQREVVKEEMRQRYDNQPYGTFLLEVLDRAYTKHPYQWPTIGSMDHLNAATEADYINFYKDFYVPNNAVLVIAGDIEPKQAKAWVEQYFSSIPAKQGKIYRPEVEEPAMKKEVRDTIFDQVQLPAVFHAYRIPSVQDKDIYAIKMLNKLLSEGESSRMRKALVDEQQKALTVFNYAMEMEDPGLAITFAITSAGVDAKDLEEAMDAEVERVRDELISEAEYSKLLNQVESDFFTDNATMFGIANNLATYHTLQGDANLINTELEKYQAVTREDIKRVANKYFQPSNRVALYYLPEPAKP